jgi:type I restriction enzyme R subunit
MQVEDKPVTGMDSTGNFEFIKGVWPWAYEDCAKAEGYSITDPRSALFYSRRAIEGLVNYIYEITDQPKPWPMDLRGKEDGKSFRSLAGEAILKKLRLIRKTGNLAVHRNDEIPPHLAPKILAELLHVVVWAALRFTDNPSAVPIDKKFDPVTAKQYEPLPPGAVQELAHEPVVQASDSAPGREAEIAALRTKIAAAQAAHPVQDTRDYSEEVTQKLIIEQLLREAGWPLMQERDRGFEVSGMPNESGVGQVDYVLWGSDDLPLAVVETEKTETDPNLGREQAKLYADCMENMFGRRPVMFYTDGFRTWLWDDSSEYPPRGVQGFFTRDELELMVERRDTRLPLTDVAISSDIVDRHYQHRGIRAIDSAFTAHQREALLVMSTGSGKTRTMIALVDQLMRAGWVKRVLILADRAQIVNQIDRAFHTHLPNVDSVNLTTVDFAADWDTGSQVYVSNYQTMMGLVNGQEWIGERIFGPGYFDLVIIDEAYRSVYQKYRSIFYWFDALLVGMTATPTDEVDDNTFALFGLEVGVPTDAYTFEEAVAEGYLVPPVAVPVPLSFIRDGLRYEDLNEHEKDLWDTAEWSDTPEVPDTESTESTEEHYELLFDEDSVDMAIAALMTHGHRVEGGDRLGKTIIFAKDQGHADFIRDRFNVNYPEYSGNFARVITPNVTHAQSLIDDFSEADKPPHIAISVGLLDSGIDVAEVCNLVFFKLVRSKSKFWQMLGRGNRLCPDLFGPGQDKQDFYVFDLCQNLEFFNQEMNRSKGSLQKSLTAQLFEARIDLLAALGAQVDYVWPEGVEPGFADMSEDSLRVDLASNLRDTVAGMSLDNLLVRSANELVERYSQWEPWQQVTPEISREVAGRLAHLPSAFRDTNEGAKRFDLLLLRLQLARLENDTDTIDLLRARVQEIAAGLLLQTAIPAVTEHESLLNEIASDQWWVDLTLPKLEMVRRQIRELINFLDKTRRSVIYADQVELQ